MIEVDVDMNAAVDELIELIKADYYNSAFTSFPSKFKTIPFFNGRKYIQIHNYHFTSSWNSPHAEMWGFIVNVDDDKKFPKGTILKSNGFSVVNLSVNRNQNCGNVLTGGYTIKWSGPVYVPDSYYEEEPT